MGKIISIGILFLIVLGFVIFNFTNTDNRSLIKPQNKIIPTPTISPLPKNTSKIAFTGEIILSREVAGKINQYGFNYPFLEVKDLLSQADLRFSTLEAPLIGKNRPCGIDCMIFVSDALYVKSLLYGKINIVSLAANHIMDAGSEGLDSTIALLTENNIKYFGAGKNLSQAQKPSVVRINNIRFGFLGFNQIPPADYFASLAKPGSAPLDESIVRDIKNLKGKTDIVIVSIHWGVEYQDKPSDSQREFAHLAIDSGADLIIGTHPHHVQSIEYYKDKLIFYSLGNFIFDQMWSEATREGMIAMIEFSSDKQIQSLDIYPFKIYDYSQPRLVNDNEKKVRLEKLMAISDSDSVKIFKKYLKNNLL